MNNKCWIDTKKPHPDGYVRWGFKDKNLNRSAHRVVYEILIGAVPAGLELDHLCRNRACYNPHHLEPVTHSENIKRGANQYSNRTHCPRGHEYNEKNTYIRSNGHRKCKVCNREKEYIKLQRKKTYGTD